MIDYEKLNVDVDTLPYSHGKGKPAVYFISDCNGHIKIGITNWIGKRLSELQTASATKLKLLQLFEVEQDQLEEVETNYHIMFQRCKIHGEWFEEELILNYLLATAHYIFNSDTLGNIIAGKKYDMRKSNSKNRKDKQ